MKKFLVTAKGYEMIGSTPVKRTASWELLAEDEIKANNIVKTRETIGNWPAGTLWLTTEVEEVKTP